MIKKSVIFKILILVMGFVGFYECSSNATIYSNNPETTTNSTVSITITSSEELENFDISINSSGGLTYCSVSSSGTINQSNGYVAFAEPGAAITTLATYTFKTPDTEGTYKVSFNVNGSINTSTVTVKNSSSSSDTTVSDQGLVAGSTDNSLQSNQTTSTQTNNANLKNLGITPNDFTGFKSTTTSYNVTVPNDVETVKVYATAQDSKATVEGTGTQTLKVGANVLKVTVTAEDGTQKTYTINVTRQEADEEEESQETTKISDENTEVAAVGEGDLIKLEIEGYDITPGFSAEVYEYTLELNSSITELNVITEAANNNIEIEVVGNDELKDGENIITILVYNTETEQNTTYQIIVNKMSVDLEGLNTTLNDGVKRANLIRNIVIGVILFIIIGIIIFIIVRHKYKVAGDDDEYDEIDDENKFNLDNEDELFSRVNKDTFYTNENKKEKSIEDDEEVLYNKDDTDIDLDDYIERKKSKGKHF